MFDKHKRESLLLRDLLKKLIIIVIGSIVAAYGITLALYAGFGGATLAVLWQGIAETFHLSIGMASFLSCLSVPLKIGTKLPCVIFISLPSLSLTVGKSMSAPLYIA